MRGRGIRTLTRTRTRTLNPHPHLHLHPHSDSLVTSVQLNIPVMVRYVLIPGLTDTAYDVAWLATFAKDHPNVTQIDVLPYHTLGVHKWAMVGLKYPMEGQRSPTVEETKEFVRAVEERVGKGVRIQATGIA
jgi:pyruvate formate lyase activating enzyme